MTDNGMYKTIWPMCGALHRSLVDEDGDSLNLLFAIYPVEVAHVKVREALAPLALLELGDVSLQGLHVCVLEELQVLVPCLVCMNELIICVSKLQGLAEREPVVQRWTITHFMLREISAWPCLAVA